MSSSTPPPDGIDPEQPSPGGDGASGFTNGDSSLETGSTGSHEPLTDTAAAEPMMGTTATPADAETAQGKTTGTTTEVPPEKVRYYWIDNLRATINLWVVVHHAAVSYGMLPVWFYYEAPKTGDEDGAALLDLFVLVNHSWFMGTLMLIAGYFVPRSLDKKGGKRFIRDRIVHLGGPLLLYLVVLRPISLIQVWENFSATNPGVPFWVFYLGSWTVGHMWFVVRLFYFSAIYVLWRYLRQRHLDQLAAAGIEPKKPFYLSRPGYLAVIAFTIGLALVEYVWRIFVPTDSGSSILGLPSADLLPQYAAFFIIGVMVQRFKWDMWISAKAGWIAAIVAFIFGFGLIPFLNIGDNAGYGTLASLIMTIWQAVLVVGINIPAIALFQRFGDFTNWLMRFYTRNAFAVYVTHAVTMVFTGYLLAPVDQPVIVKTVLLSIISIPASWIVAAGFRAVPGLKKIF
ncbi:MAG: acyltransferase [Propionibacteriaceae bacterium]|nr:acyltransferase [Propionibacteriaceae bacterium]